MSYIDWKMIGPEISTCNCDWGCPCQFNALPTHGNCRAGVAMRIDQGHFGDVSLDGLCWAGMFAWPGAIHEGGGEALIVVEEKADERQREAILKILSGKETAPGATFFNVVACAAAMRIGKTGVSRDVLEATKAMEVVALRSLPAGVGSKPPLSGIG